MQKIVV